MFSEVIFDSIFESTELWYFYGAGDAVQIVDTYFLDC